MAPNPLNQLSVKPAIDTHEARELGQPWAKDEAQVVVATTLTVVIGKHGVESLFQAF